MFLNPLDFVLAAIELSLEGKKEDQEMLKRIAGELKNHSPFTALGALTGIILMAIVVFAHVPSGISQTLFYALHPLHVLLSALVTTAMYTKYRKSKIWVVILISWTGSIGIATISDIIIPFLSGTLLDIPMEFHLPFIEEWWLVNPLALIGIAIGYWKQVTKIPHFGHILLSTWASLFYFTAFGIADWIALLPFIFLFLFLAVWVPCCTSDIIYPLLLVRKEQRLPLQGREEITD